MKGLRKEIAFVCTLMLTATTIFATPEYHKQYEKLTATYKNGSWYTHSGDNSPTGLSIKISKNKIWNDEIVLQRISETHKNGTLGLVQEFATKGLDGKFVGFTEESFIIGTTKFFKTTDDINKGILPTTKYIKPIVYTSRDIPDINSYILDMNDAKKVVEEYAKTNKIANYYYKSMDDMRYDGEYINGVRSGFGEMYNLDGDLIYIGMWENGTFDGFGITFYDGEASYIGEWDNGFPKGMGVFKKNPTSKYYTEGYFYINDLNSVSWMEISSKYKSRNKNEEVSNMKIPFKENKDLYTIDDLDRGKLLSICDNYEEFKTWSEEKSEEIIAYYNKKARNY